MKALLRSVIAAAAAGVAVTAAPPLRVVGSLQPSAASVEYQQPQFTSGTESVALTVTVADSQGRPTRGLQRENFVVFDDDAVQDVRVFSAETVPVSWGLVLDRSGSMAGMIDDVYTASLHAMDLASRADEAFVTTFNDRVTVEHEFTNDRHALQNAVVGLRAEGGTALWDAVDDGVGRMASGVHRKKVLIVVTDGDDNESHRRFAEILGTIERTDVIIYTVGLIESRGLFPWTRSMDATLKRTLTRLAEATGGSAHFPDSMKKCQEVMSAIAQEVHSQYLLGYDPPGPPDGQWHRVRVEIRSAAAEGVRTARTREGYYHGPSARQAER